MPTIAILGTMDTKGVEHGFVADVIRQRGHQTLIIDVGTLGDPQIKPDITRNEIAFAAGVDLAALVAKRDRGEAVGAMSRGAPIVLSKLVSEGRIQGVISLGGGGGTAIGTAAMRALPIGFPKLMVSTLASGNTSQYVGVKDIVMFPSIVDVAGLNRISREILTRAAGAICGMVEAKPAAGEEKPVIVASQFGNTTACVDHARKILEAAGYEVLAFHARARLLANTTRTSPLFKPLPEPDRDELLGKFESELAPAGTTFCNLGVTAGGGAAGSIDDCGAPLNLKGTRLPSGQYRVDITGGAPNLLYRILATGNFTSWQTIGTMTRTNTTTSFVDPSGSNLPRRFYRVVLGN